jgi:ABC-type bacteriocin/lantibiotic exporter with double-glycine peptidase domain
MKTPGMFTSIMVPALLLLLTGCAAYSRPQVINSSPEEAFLIPDVPFFPEKEQLCGPASLQSLFAYWGKPVPREEISHAIYLPQIKGTFNFDLVNFARSKGFLTELPAGSIEEIERQVRTNHPVIAFLNLGNSLFPLGHYIVIIGYDHLNQELIVHSGQNAFERISYQTFANQWKSTDRWMLIILPPAGKNG